MEKNRDTFLHYTEGKAQSKRFLKELDPSSFNLHDFNVVDWLLFAYNFSKHINYFDKGNNASPEGDWQAFIDYFKIEELINGLELDNPEKLPRKESLGYKKLEKSILEKLSEFEGEQNLAPHLGLFMSFVKLLDFSKEKFNNLTKRHLDFYYEEILKIEKRTATPDKAYVIFELAKKAVQERIPEGTLLNAQKDANGKKLVYKTDKELIANQSKVVSLKSFLNDGKLQELKIAEKTNTLDGLEEELPEESNYWWPFGYNSEEVNYKELPNADLGFSIASSLFNLKEGKRTVTVAIEYQTISKGKLEGLSEQDIKDNIEIHCSGEKEWLKGVVLSKVSNTDTALIVSFELAKDFPAVTAYNATVLLETFDTELPVVRFLIKGERRYEVYKVFSQKTIKNIEVTVAVEGVTSALLENDNSKLNSEKPFFPFTAQPIKGSNFDIRYPELFSKKWENVEVKIDWKNTPESITDLYEAYTLNPNQRITKGEFDSSTATSIVANDAYFKAKSFLLDSEEWRLKNPNVVLFNKTNDGYKTSISISNSGSTPNSAEAIRLSLNQTALQEVYPKLYTLALTNSTGDKSIPNEPYDFKAERVELSYTAKEKAYSYLDSKSGPVKNEGTQLFYEDVFGQYEKEEASSDLVPVYNEGGEFYIGVEATVEQDVSLLIQTLEGSENPLSETFLDNEKIAWEILSNNKWIDLSENILTDETNNFLKSGIVKFKIPKTINTNNTRLPKDLIWIKVKMNKSYDAVCKLQGVFAQAMVATFQDSDNHLAHLKEGLNAGTISKLITRIPKIKSVSQKYNSFGGIYEETDIEYYRRISERLRHKNRAITQWDYEQLVLQEFPEVYKVKCLKHTSEESFMSPGDVTLIVVPDTKNKNTFDIYQPRVSRATLKAIKSYVNELNSLHVNTIVKNPDYQEIQVDIVVKFFEEYDESFYKKQLDLDIKKYLSPWAFDTEIEMDADININSNLLVNYIEHLPYVDYIENLSMSKDGEKQGKSLTKADPKAILVSAKQHKITIAEHNCIYK